MSIGALMLLGCFDSKCYNCGAPLGPFSCDSRPRGEKDPDLCDECEAEKEKDA